jgi:hypothetical protein
LIAVWVEEHPIVGDEFRDGNVPGNKDPLTRAWRRSSATSQAVSALTIFQSR